MAILDAADGGMVPTLPPAPLTLVLCPDGLDMPRDDGLALHPGLLWDGSRVPEFDCSDDGFDRAVAAAVMGMLGAGNIVLDL